MYLIDLALAGIWAQVWHWGTGIGLIILCLAGAYFTTAIPIIGPHLAGARKDLLWAAAVIAVFLGGQALGAHDEARKQAAKVLVIEKNVTKAVTNAKTPAAQHRKDKFDDPKN
jgi:hypothetical protein